MAPAKKEFIEIHDNQTRSSYLRHWLYAISHALLVLTKDHNDFEDLHLVVQATHGHHPGILAIRSDNDASRAVELGAFACRSESGIIGDTMQR